MPFQLYWHPSLCTMPQIAPYSRACFGSNPLNSAILMLLRIFWAVSMGLCRIINIILQNYEGTLHVFPFFIPDSNLSPECVNKVNLWRILLYVWSHLLLCIKPVQPCLHDHLIFICQAHISVMPPRIRPISRARRLAEKAKAPFSAANEIAKKSLGIRGKND